jgi:hypothetical protein
VEDLLRERQVLAKVLAEAGRRTVQMGLDWEPAFRFLRTQIYASTIVQRELLARWQIQNRRRPPPRPPDALCRRRHNASTVITTPVRSVLVRVSSNGANAVISLVLPSTST